MADNDPYGGGFNYGGGNEDYIGSSPYVSGGGYKSILEIKNEGFGWNKPTVAIINSGCVIAGIVMLIFVIFINSETEASLVTSKIALFLIIGGIAGDIVTEWTDSPWGIAANAGIMGIYLAAQIF
jgi:hypothetical protein